MSEIYGSQFANQYGKVGGEAFQTWCLGLRDFEPKMIRAGFAKLLDRESKFVPNLNEFRSLCLPSTEQYGLPPVDQAYREACNRRPLSRDWSHPAVWLAGKRTGWLELKSNSEAKMKPVFKQNYESVCKDVMDGKEISLPEIASNALEHVTDKPKVRTEESKKAGRDQIAKLQGLFAGESAESKGDK